MPACSISRSFTVHSHTIRSAAARYRPSNCLVHGTPRAIRTLVRYTGGRMDTERRIAEIEWLEHIFAVPDTRPLSQSDLAAANRRHDDKLARSPWFRLWQRYGVCSADLSLP